MSQGTFDLSRYPLPNAVLRRRCASRQLRPAPGPREALQMQIPAPLGSLLRSLACTGCKWSLRCNCCICTICVLDIDWMLALSSKQLLTRDDIWCICYHIYTSTYYKHSMQYIYIYIAFSNFRCIFGYVSLDSRYSMLSWHLETRIDINKINKFAHVYVFISYNQY